MRIQPNNNYPPWLRGSFPQWLVVFLLGLIGLGAREAYIDFKKTITKAVEELHSQDKRILRLEDWRSQAERRP